MMITGCYSIIPLLQALKCIRASGVFEKCVVYAESILKLESLVGVQKCPELLEMAYKSLIQTQQVEECIKLLSCPSHFGGLYIPKSKCSRTCPTCSHMFSRFFSFFNAWFSTGVVAATSMTSFPISRNT